jgi:hypothetical protein
MVLHKREREKERERQPDRKTNYFHEIHIEFEAYDITLFCEEWRVLGCYAVWLL